MKYFLNKFLLLLCLGQPMISCSQNAHDLDSTFGVNGIVVTDIGSMDNYIFAMALQADGKIIAAGIHNSADLILGRYLANGKVDSTFGTSGFTIIPTNVSSSSKADVVIQSDGKILVTGIYRTGSNSDFVVIRLNADGTIDTGFGVAGLAITDLGNNLDWPGEMTLQADGKILVAGHTGMGNPLTSNAALVRYNSDGSLDNTFGTGGKVIQDLSVGQEDYFNSVAVRPNGKIVAAGSYNNGTDADYVAVQYNADGTLDNSFGTSGVVAVDYDTRPNNCKAMTLQADGKVVLTGDHSSTTSYDYMTVRLTQDGKIDSSFGTTGIVISAFGTSTHLERGWDLIQQPSGNIVIVGEYRDWANVVRYLPNGTLDAGFATGGNLTLDIPPGSIDKGRALLIQPDGKILLGGNTVNAENDFWMARLHGDLSTPSGVGEQHINTDCILYPNPAGDQVRLQFDRSQAEPRTIQLCTLTGTVLQSLNTQESLVTLDLKNVESGFYFIRTVSEEGMSCLKFIRM